MPTSTTRSIAPLHQWRPDEAYRFSLRFRPKVPFLHEGEAGGAWLDQVHPEDRNYCFTAMRAAFDRREPFEIEFRMRRHDGEYRWLVDRGSPMRNPEGEITGYLGVAHDVTSHRTADLARRHGLSTTDVTCSSDSQQPSTRRRS